MEEKNFRITYKDNEIRKRNNVTCFLYFRGIIFSFLGGFFSSVSSAIVKYLTNISTEEILLFRFSAIAVFFLPLAVLSGDNLLGRKNSRLVMFLTAISGVAGTLLNYLSIKHLPLGDASVICYSFPVFVTIAARIVLKEPFGCLQLLATFITIIGIALISKMHLLFSNSGVDFHKKEYIIGISAAVGAVICYTVNIILYKLCKNVHYAVIGFTIGWVGVISSVILVIATKTYVDPNCGLDSLLMLSIGIFSFLRIMFFQLGLEYENTGVATTVRVASDIISIYLWQICFFNDIPDVYSIFGAFLVSSCVIIISSQKWISLVTHGSTAKNLRMRIFEKLRK